MAGYVALTGKVLNIEDAYQIPPAAEYKIKIMQEIDSKGGYHTKSMLVVPMYDINGEIIGVLSLINSLNEEGQPQPYDKEFEQIILSLASQAAVAIKNTRLLEEVRQHHLDTIHRLALAAEYRDDDTGQHIKRISAYSTLIARNMGLPLVQIEIIKHASPMHDVGKIGVPDAIIRKPGKLTKEEFESIKDHPGIGAKILGGSQGELLNACEIIAFTHHEWFNGTGYPRGLKGEDIPLYGRIVALADVFDALTTERCYKPAFPLEESLKIIRQETGTHFDTRVVKAFMRNLDEVTKIAAKNQREFP
jgi:HD-GYP domain-containing protein (c-di-GMP phosphodiesterase class II)